jgi:competence protein ComEC
MPVYLLALAGGILTVGFLPYLPPIPWLLSLVPLLLIALRISRFRIVLAYAIGFGWGVIYGYGILANQLPQDLVGRDLMVSGRVVDLPVIDERRQRFVLQVDAAYLLDDAHTAIADFPERLQLSWYAKDAVAVRSGERWQWQVRLKRPRGFVNPGGFDYQVWLMRRGIGGVGYVRESHLSQRIAVAARGDIGAHRHALRDWLLASTDSPQRAVLLALLIGDRSMMDVEQWRRMQLTGVNHLVAISGLHVGFLAVAGFVLGSLIGRCINLVYHPCPALVPGYLGAVLLALGYSALAGFTLPTQRALVMILVVQLVYLWRRSYRVSHIFSLALVSVVISDPLAAYDMGFWLSFGAVAVLLFSFAGRYGARQSFAPVHWLNGLVRSQWTIFIGLLLPLGVLLNQVSLLAPLANLIAIPLVTTLVVPPLLLAAVIQSIFPLLSHWLLQLADLGLRVLDAWLQSLLDLGSTQSNPVISLQGWALVIALVGVLLLLLPRGIAGRWLGYPALLTALILPGKIPPPLTLTILDVGQGLAVVVETPDHRLIYDTGPAYSDKFEAGGAIVVPYLRQRGISQVDKLIVSHHDKDHSGGVQGIIKNLAIHEVVAGEPMKAQSLLDHPIPVHNCHAYEAWEWNQVHFSFVPTAEVFRGASGSANNRSCVLLIEYAGQRILLPGDIEGRVENRLVNQRHLPEALTLVVASHHGSRSSSTSTFVSHVRPEFVVYSAGYRSQHGHPHQEVVARYAARGSRAFNTAEGGALVFSWQEGVLQPVRQQRLYQPRYWFD